MGKADRIDPWLPEERAVVKEKLRSELHAQPGALIFVPMKSIPEISANERVSSHDGHGSFP